MIIFFHSFVDRAIDNNNQMQILLIKEKETNEFSIRDSAFFPINLYLLDRFVKDQLNGLLKINANNMSFYFSFIFSHMNIHMSSTHLSISFVLLRVSSSSSSSSKREYSAFTCWFPFDDLEWWSINTVRHRLIHLTFTVHRKRNFIMKRRKKDK